MSLIKNMPQNIFDTDGFTLKWTFHGEAELFSFRRESEEIMIKIHKTINSIHLSMPTLLPLNEENRIIASKIIQKMIIFSKEKHEDRVRIVSGLINLSYDWKVIKNIESYHERCSDVFVKHLTEKVNKIYQKAKGTKTTITSSNFVSVPKLFVQGKDASFFVEELKKLKIAKIKVLKEDIYYYQINFDAGFVKNQILTDLFYKELENLNYNCSLN